MRAAPIARANARPKPSFGFGGGRSLAMDAAWFRRMW
jgi:hypothetical protein